MVSSAKLPDGWQPIIDGALAAAKSAHEERNRVVHDRWMKEDVSPRGWQRLRAAKGAIGFKARRNEQPRSWCRRTTRSCAFGRDSARLGLHCGALLPWLRGSEFPEFEDTLARQRQLVADDFKLLPDGGARVRRDDA